MPITTTFINKRCFFNGFTPGTDKISKDGMAGVDYCRFNFVGAILAIFGITYRIHCEKNNTRYNCYVYAKSFKNWVKSHEEILDKPFNTSQKINSLVAENYIKTICEKSNQVGQHMKTRIINPGKPLSVEKVIEKVQKDFAEHQYKDEILESVKRLVTRHKYKEDLEKLQTPSFQKDAAAWSWHLHDLNEHQKEIYLIACDFVDTLPGVDVTPYTGQIVK